MLIVSVHCIQTIHHIVLFLVGCGVAQREQGVELFQALLGLLALNALRFVDNQNRVGLSDNVNRTTAAECIERLVDNLLVLAGIERLHIDDHYVDGAVRCKVINVCQSAGTGIIDKEANLLAVLIGKVLLRGLEGLVNALTDSDRRHNDDKLAPAVALIKLVHGLDIGIGFAGAGFHFNRQIDARASKRL